MKPSENRNLYKNILISLVVSIVLTLLISSTLLIMNFESIAIRQVSRSDLNSLKQASQEAAKMTDTAKTLSFQIYGDLTISKLIFFPKPDIFDVTLAMQQLNNYRLSMPFIESIYVYNASSGMYYISSDSFRNGSQTEKELDDRGIVNIFQNIKEYRPYYPIPRTYTIGSSKQVSSYSYLSYDMLEKKPSAAVVVNIAESWVNNDYGLLSRSGSGAKTFIINEQGMLHSRSGSDPMLTDYSGKGYIRNILDHRAASDYFVDTVDGVKSLVSYTAPDSLGWRYVRTTPYSEITREITSMRTKTIYFSVSVLLLGLLLSVVATRRLYGPIDKVLKQLKTLETERRDHQHIVKQHFLSNIVLRREVYSPQALQDKLAQFGSSIRVDHHARLVLLKLDRYKECVDQYQDHIKLVKYAIINIGTEISAFASFYAEGVDIGDERVLLLLTGDDPQRISDREALASMLHSMQEAVRDHLKVSVSFTVSPVRPSVDQTILLYNEVKEASLHRLFYGYGCLLWSEDIMNLKQKDYAFPVHREKQLVDCLMTGKSDEAKTIYSDMVRATAEYPYSVVQLTISHLTFTVINVLNTIRKNNAIVIEADFDSALASLNQVEVIEEITTQFFGIFDRLSKQLEERRSSKQDELVKRINEIIEREYANPNLCLNSIADELDMSPIYISRLYKQMTFFALTDVIQEVRMNKSKQLLLESDYSVADIAKQTGFTNSSYFYRMFKKSNGVTPNDFRKQAPRTETI
ncbi:AraC family transcriptional regulator [Paenibacillus allorhizosphaerae]|uniref:HTH-type transcriptional activator RhaR n=1 Tax=Paenibacillus allorhizosphaerae TaxID=2849866 RepID=A0ABM8VR71_9BACL|nr:AraC family transcriptional regulator [Paenibacillus allorhizosphaerae]CAG7654973.1 HTH-type transcriptional activator RhaR [Paenibacillus allorhizosphaerae]